MVELLELAFRVLWQALMAFLYWRVLLCVGVSSLIAIWGVGAFSWINGLQGLVFVFLAYMFGRVWNEYAAFPKNRNMNAPAMPPAKTSVMVACLATMFGAFVWGGVSSLTLGSAIFGAVVLAAVLAVVYVRRSRVHMHRIPRIYAVTCGACAIIGYLAPMLQLAKSA